MAEKNATPTDHLTHRKQVIGKIIRIALICIAVMLIPAGVYFLTLFQKTHWNLSSTSSTTLNVLAATAIAVGIAILLWNILRPGRGEIGRLPLRLMPLFLIPIVFLAQVEIFGLWLGNNDEVFEWMNRPFLGARVITGTKPHDLLYLSPDATRLLAIEANRSWRPSVMSLSGRTLWRITAPGASFSGFLPSWSPRGDKLAGCYTVNTQEGGSARLFLWTFDVETGRMNSKEVATLQSLTPFRLDPSWSPDARSLALSHVFKGHDAKGYTTIDSGQILILDSKNLSLLKSINANNSSNWVRFLDSNTLLYCHSPKSLSSIETQLWTMKIGDGSKRVIPLDRSLPTSTIVFAPPVVDRGRKLIIALKDPNIKETGRPYQATIVDISTGAKQPISGLDQSKELAGLMWLSYSVDGHGDLAFIEGRHDISMWPHASPESLYYWKNGSNTFMEYRPGVFPKRSPSLDSSGKKMVFHWSGHWYITDLPVQMTN